jgi:hypothetical protein
MAQNQDRISDALVYSIAAMFGGTVLSVPWYGFAPLAAVVSGLLVACGAFKAVQQHRR